MAEGQGLEVSFVVIAHNEASGIERALSSIACQRPADALAEIIVVDDGSTDQMPQILARLAAVDPRVRVIRLDHRQGRGRARQVGVEEASGQLIAMVDADIELPPDWLSRCLEELRATGSQAVSGIAVPDGDVAFLAGRLPLTPRPRPHATPITGSNALLQRSIFEQVGFDSRLRNGEDVALGYALRERGIRTHTIADLIVAHHDHRSAPQAFAWMFESGIGASRQLARHHQPRLPDAAFAGLLAVGLAVARGGPRRWWPAIPAYVLAVAGAHVHRKFVISPRRPGAALAAVLMDAVLLGAYLSGRTLGLLRFGLSARQA